MVDRDKGLDVVLLDGKPERPTQLRSRPESKLSDQRRRVADLVPNFTATADAGGVMTANPRLGANDELLDVPTPALANVLLVNRSLERSRAAD